SSGNRAAINNKPAEGYGGNEYPVLADSGVQRNFVRSPAVSGRQRPVADLWGHAHRQPGAWLLLPPGRLCGVVRDLDHGPLATCAPGRGPGDRADRIADGAHLPATAGIRAAAASLADGGVRVPVPASRTRYLDRQQLRYHSTRCLDEEHRRWWSLFAA